MPALNTSYFRSLLGSFDKAGAVREKREEQKSPLSKLKSETDTNEAWTSGFQPPHVRTSRSPPSRTVPQIGWVWKADRSSAEFSAWLPKLYSKTTGFGSGQPGLYYCTPCSDAASDAGAYNRRIGDLFLTQLECSLCEGRTYAANFSAAQRRNADDGSRVCVAHEGRWKLCSHLSFGWEDVVRRDWSRDPGYRKTEHGWTVTLTCCHPRHHKKERPALEITKDTRTDNDGVSVATRLTQDFYPRVRNLDDQIDACVSKIYSMLDAELAVLCPHLRATPGRIRSFGTHATSEDKMEYTCRCLVCGLDFRFLLADGVERLQPQISCQRVDFLDRSCEEWGPGVAPESYGLFSDEQTKNVLWCDDDRCATSFELASCHISYIWIPSALGCLKRKGDTAAGMAAALDLGRSVSIEWGMYMRGERRESMMTYRR